jgi:adenosylmethionine-8-amino-7-oxononanoate aminotransferase
MFFTFGAHPTACAAADKVLEIMQREALVARAAEMGAKLMARLRKLEDHPHVAEVRGKGMMLGVEFVRDKETGERFGKQDNFTGRVVGAGFAEGVFFYPAGGGPAPDAVMLGPPFIIGDEEIELMAGALERAVESAARLTLATG